MANQKSEDTDQQQKETNRPLERRHSVRAAMARYEAEEEAFLRELAQMEAECAEKDEEGKAAQQLNGDTAQTVPEPAMLGTLCTLIGEIAKLRRENGRLKRRLTRHSDQNGAENGPETRPTGVQKLRNVQQQQSVQWAALGCLSRRLLPPAGTFPCLPLQSSGGSSSCCGSSSAVSGLFARQQSRLPSSFGGGSRMATGRASRGAQEQLSSPPPPGAQKGHLSVSAYSADLSSDSSLLFPRRHANNGGEMAVGDGKESRNDGNDGIGGHLAGQEWPEEMDKNGRKEPSSLLVSSRRGMGRRADERKGGDELKPTGGGQGQQQQLLSCSMTTTPSGTSPSAGSSASSSVEPPINGATSAGDGSSIAMSASRSSFFELFGWGGQRRQQQRQGGGSPCSSTLGAAFASAVDSLVTRRMGGGRKRPKWTSARERAALGMEGNADGGDGNVPMANNESPPYSPAHSPYTDGYSSGGNVEREATVRIDSEPDLIGRTGRRRPTANVGKGRRPQSCFLEAIEGEQQQLQWMGGRTKSCRSVATNGANKDSCSSSRLALARRSGKGRRGEQGRDEEEEERLRMEMQLLKARNARLIEQLREKSARLSTTEARLKKYGQELEQFRAHQRFNERIEGLSLRARQAMDMEGPLQALEQWLDSRLLGRLQALKVDAQRQQQMALEAAKRDREALQLALAEVERLRHDNFTLLQSLENRGQSGQRLQNNVQGQFELFPSFDALYSFAAGLVKKLAQMRQFLAQKCADEFRADVDLLMAYAQLLVAQAQIERQRIRLAIFCPENNDTSDVNWPETRENYRNRIYRRRPLSFHGNSHAQRVAHGRLQFFVPFKLHGQRLATQRKRHLGGASRGGREGGAFDALVEANEQSIEAEFLRLFHSARSLSRICTFGQSQEEESELYMDRNLHKASPNNGRRRLTGQQLEKGVEMDVNNSPNLLMSSSCKRMLLQRRTQSAANPNPSPPQQPAEAPSSTQCHGKASTPQRQKLRRNSLIQREHCQPLISNTNSPTASPLFKFRRFSAILGQNHGLNVGQNGNGTEGGCQRGTPVLTRHNALADSTSFQGQGQAGQGGWLLPRASRPQLVRQNSTTRGPSPEALVESDRRHPQCHRAPSLLRPPTPSAPPMALLLQSSTCSQMSSSNRLAGQQLTAGKMPPDQSPSRFGFLPEGRSPSRVGGIGSSSTRRPLTRAGDEANKAALGHAPRDDSANSNAGNANAKCGSRSSSMSRLPKATAGKSSSSGAQQQQAPGAAAGGGLQMTKAVRKAGNSWLNRLRGRGGGGGGGELKPG